MTASMLEFARLHGSHACIALASGDQGLQSSCGIAAAWGPARLLSAGVLACACLCPPLMLVWLLTAEVQGLCTQYNEFCQYHSVRWSVTDRQSHHEAMGCQHEGKRGEHHSAALCMGLSPIASVPDVLCIALQA